MLLRGENVVSLEVQGPAPVVERKLGGLTKGPGIARPAGRGLPTAPVGAAPAGLAGPVRGVGGPGMPGMMPPGAGMGMGRGMPAGFPPRGPPM